MIFLIILNEQNTQMCHININRNYSLQVWAGFKPARAILHMPREKDKYTTHLFDARYVLSQLCYVISFFYFYFQYYYYFSCTQ